MRKTMTGLEGHGNIDHSADKSTISQMDPQMALLHRNVEL